MGKIHSACTHRRSIPQPTLAANIIFFLFYFLRSLCITICRMHINNHRAHTATVVKRNLDFIYRLCLLLFSYAFFFLAWVLFSAFRLFFISPCVWCLLVQPITTAAPHTSELNEIGRKFHTDKCVICLLIRWFFSMNLIDLTTFWHMHNDRFNLSTGENSHYKKKKKKLYWKSIDEQLFSQN